MSDDWQAGIYRCSNSSSTKVDWKDAWSCTKSNSNNSSNSNNNKVRNESINDDDKTTPKIDNRSSTNKLVDCANTKLLPSTKHNNTSILMEDLNLYNKDSLSALFRPNNKNDDDFPTDNSTKFLATLRHTNKISHCYDDDHHHHHRAVVPAPKIPCYERVFYPRPNSWQRTRISEKKKTTQKKVYNYTASTMMKMKAPCCENTLQFQPQQPSEKQKQQYQHQHQPKLVIIADKNNTTPSHDVHEEIHLLSKCSGGGGDIEDDEDSTYEQVELLLGDDNDEDDAIFSYDSEQEDEDANDADHPLSGEHIIKHSNSLASKVSCEHILHQTLKQQQQKTTCNDLAPSSSLSYSTSSSASASASVSSLSLSSSSTLSSSTSSTTSSISTRNVIGKDSSNNFRRYSTETTTTTTKMLSTTKATRSLPVTTSRQLSSSQLSAINTIENKTSFGEVKVCDLISKWESRDDTDLVSNTTTKQWLANDIRVEHVENLRNKKGDYCIRRCHQHQHQYQHQRERQCKRHSRSRLDRALCGIYDKCYCRYCTKWDDIALDKIGDNDDLDPMGGFEEPKNQMHTTNLEEEEDDNDNDGVVLQQELQSMNMNVLNESNWNVDETKAAVVGCVEDSAFDNFSSPFNPCSLTFH